MAVPTVNSCTPNNGKLAGGTSVTLSGTDFTGTLSVTFDGVPATNVVEVSDVEITCDTPVHAAGAVDIVVTNGDGPGTLVAGYTYNPLPTFVSVTPDVGALAGGTSVTIAGTGFLAGAAVTFDGTPATNIVVVNDTTITCDTPAHAVGQVNIVITNTDTQAATAVNGYRYHDPPTITSISPNNGPLAGGNVVVVTGTNLDNVITFLIDGVQPTWVLYVSDTEIQCTPDAHAAGACDVVFTNTFGQAYNAVGGYTYNPLPTVASISPDNGKIAGGTAVTVTGTGFLAGAVVDFMILGFPFAATSVVVVNDTTITCLSPAAAGGSVAGIRVTNLDTQADTLAAAYTYNPIPTLATITPDNGYPGEACTLAGTGFLAGAVVTFDGIPALNVVVVSPLSITCDAPAPTNPGPSEVIVTNTDTQASNTLNFTYTHSDPHDLPPYGPGPYPTYVPAINPTGVGPAVPLVANAPLAALPSVPPAQTINWTPVAPTPTPTATAPVASASASILLSDGTPFTGSSAPYVAGDGGGEGEESGGARIVSTSIRLVPS